jgi:hypothetical protein
MAISTSTQELLKAQAGRGVSSDPALLIRNKVRQLQNTSKMPKHGLGAPGLFVLPDESQTCVSKLRVILGFVYAVLVERGPDDKPVGREHHVLPAEAVKDGYGWRLPNKNVLEQEARLVGLFNGVEAEFDLSRTGMKVARALNADARARVKKGGLPIFGLAYEFGSLECTNDKGQPYYSSAFTFLGNAGEPEGPTEAEVIQASALCDLVENVIAEATREAEQMAQDRKGTILLPHKPPLRSLITSGNAALKAIETVPPPGVDIGPDDDIPF